MRAKEHDARRPVQEGKSDMNDVSKTNLKDIHLRLGEDERFKDPPSPGMASLEHRLC